jgi:hypothetical protein
MYTVQQYIIITYLFRNKYFLNTAIGSGECLRSSARQYYNTIIVRNVLNLSLVPLLRSASFMYKVISYRFCTMGNRRYTSVSRVHIRVMILLLLSSSWIIIIIIAILVELRGCRAVSPCFES